MAILVIGNFAMSLFRITKFRSPLFGMANSQSLEKSEQLIILVSLFFLTYICVSEPGFTIPDGKSGFRENFPFPELSRTHFPVRVFGFPDSKFKNLKVKFFGQKRIPESL